MKLITLLTLFIALSAFAQEDEKKKEPQKYPMDEADKQVLQRDVCRRNPEAVATKYDQLSKEEIQKIKETCSY